MACTGEAGLRFPARNLFELNGYNFASELVSPEAISTLGKILANYQENCVVAAETLAQKPSNDERLQAEAVLLGLEHSIYILWSFGWEQSVT